MRNVDLQFFHEIISPHNGAKDGVSDVEVCRDQSRLHQGHDEELEGIQLADDGSEGDEDDGGDNPSFEDPSKSEKNRIRSTKPQTRTLV